MDFGKRRERFYSIKRANGFTDAEIDVMWEKNIKYDEQKKQYEAYYRRYNSTVKRKPKKKDIEKWKRIQVECKALGITYGQYQVMKANGTYPGKE